MKEDVDRLHRIIQINLIEWEGVKKEKLGMNRYELKKLVSQKLKLVRVEAGFTQEQMSHMIGISKKTLVQIEKGRLVTGWTAVVAVCALFSESQVLNSALDGNPLEVVNRAAVD